MPTNDILWALPADLDPSRTHLSVHPSDLPIWDIAEADARLTVGIGVRLTPIRDFGTFGLEIEEDGEFQFDFPCPDDASLFRIEGIAVAGSAEELVEGSDLHEALRPGAYDVQILAIGKEVLHQVFMAEDGTLRLRDMPEPASA